MCCTPASSVRVWVRRLEESRRECPSSRTKRPSPLFGLHCHATGEPLRQCASGQPAPTNARLSLHAHCHSPHAPRLGAQARATRQPIARGHSLLCPRPVFRPPAAPPDAPTARAAQPIAAGRRRPARPAHWPAQKETRKCAAQPECPPSTPQQPCPRAVPQRWRAARPRQRASSSRRQCWSAHPIPRRVSTQARTTAQTPARPPDGAQSASRS